MKKLHDLPPRILDEKGRPAQRQHLHSKTSDIGLTHPGLNLKKAKTTEWKPRKRAPNEVRAPNQAYWRHGIYRTGDGEIGFALRPGADDHKQWLSAGGKT